MTPARGERHVHFSPESVQPVGEALHQGLRRCHGHQIQSDSDDPFTGPASEGNATAGIGLFSQTQVLFIFLFNFNFYAIIIL